MKKKITLTSIAVWLILIVCFVYCGFFVIVRPVQKESGGTFSTKFKFGLVQTTSDTDTSYITYYNADLTKVYSQKLNKISSLGETVEHPQVTDSKAYLVSQNPAQNTNSQIIAIDLTSGKKKTYDVGQKTIEHYQAASNAIYTTATTNGEVILSKYVKKTKETSTLSLGKVQLDTLRLHGGMLFAFITVDGKASIQMIDTTSMAITTTYPIPDFKGNVTSTCIAGNSIFFAYENASDTKNPSGIGVLNLFDKTIVTKPLTLAHASQIFYSEDKVIVTGNNSNQVAVYNTITEKTDYVELKNNSIQSTVSGTSLYSMDEKTLTEYNLSDFTVKKTVNLTFKDKDTIKFHYSSFFTK